MAFYFALFNVSNANQEARDKTLKQHFTTSYAQPATQCAQAHHASRLDTSARETSQRRHSISNDNRIIIRPKALSTVISSTADEKAAIDAPRHCSLPIKRAQLSPTTAIVTRSTVSYHNTNRDASTKRPRAEVMGRLHASPNNQLQAGQGARHFTYNNNNSKDNTTSMISMLSSYSSSTSCTPRSSSSSGTNGGGIEGNSTTASLSTMTSAAPPLTDDSNPIAKEASTTATYWQAKRKNLKHILRRNSAAACFLRHKQHINDNQDKIPDEKMILKDTHTKSSVVAGDAIPKRVKFMAVSVSRNVINSPTISSCSWLHDKATTLTEASPMPVSALAKYRVRTPIPPLRKSSLIRNHARKLSADNISFLKHADLNEWNVRAVILPSRSRKVASNSSGSELIEIMPARQHHQQQLTKVETNNNDIHYKASKGKREDREFFNDRCCMPMQLDNKTRRTLATIRRAKSSHTTSTHVAGAPISRTCDGERRRRHRRHSDEGRAVPLPAITLTTCADAQPQTLLRGGDKSVTSPRQAVPLTNRRKDRHSTSDHGRLASCVCHIERRISDGQNYPTCSHEKEPVNRLLSRFKNLFKEQDVGAGSCAKESTGNEEGYRDGKPRCKLIWRHFSAQRRSRRHLREMLSERGSQLSKLVKYDN